MSKQKSISKKGNDGESKAKPVSTKSKDKAKRERMIKLSNELLDEILE